MCRRWKQFRRELLERAKPFYAEFIAQQPDNERFVTEMGFAHFRLGEISRMLDSTQDAETEYRASIALFDDLVRDQPAECRPSAGARQRVQRTRRAAETIGHSPRRGREGLRERARAAECADAEFPANDTYQQELARTLLQPRRSVRRDRRAERRRLSRRGCRIFAQAIRVLEPLAQKPGKPQAAQELARVYNNLARPARAGRAGHRRDCRPHEPYYERAVRIHQDLTARDPRNREYKLELAKFSNNYAELLRELGEFGRRRRTAAAPSRLLDELVRPAPSLGIEQADAHNLRARILHSQGSPEREAEYREALRLFQSLAGADEAARHPAFHQRYTDLLMNLSAFRRDRPNADSARATAVRRGAVVYRVRPTAERRRGRRKDAPWSTDCRKSCHF